MHPILRTDNFHYTLRIVNRTRFTFHYVEGELRYGRWHRDGVENAPPTPIPPNSEAEAMGLYAPPTSTKGYACRCVWADATNENQRTGHVAVTISVPFLPGKNSAGLDASGPFIVEGWTGVPRSGHEFSHTLTIRETAW